MTPGKNGDWSILQVYQCPRAAGSNTLDMEWCCLCVRRVLVKLRVMATPRGGNDSPRVEGWQRWCCLSGSQCNSNGKGRVVNMQRNSRRDLCISWCVNGSHLLGNAAVYAECSSSMATSMVEAKPEDEPDFTEGVAPAHEVPSDKQRDQVEAAALTHDSAEVESVIHALSSAHLGGDDVAPAEADTGSKDEQQGAPEPEAADSASACEHDSCRLLQLLKLSLHLLRVET
eukprot:3683-Amphidinium_carterae.1